MPSHLRQPLQALVGVGQAGVQEAVGASSRWAGWHVGTFGSKRPSVLTSCFLGQHCGCSLVPPTLGHFYWTSDPLLGPGRSP